MTKLREYLARLLILLINSDINVAPRGNSIKLIKFKFLKIEFCKGYSNKLVDKDNPQHAVLNKKMSKKMSKKINTESEYTESSSESQIDNESQEDTESSESQEDTKSNINEYSTENKNKTGIIYIINFPNEKQYVGQHCENTLKKRKKDHKSQFNRFKKIKNGDLKSKNMGCRALYEAWMIYSFKECKWNILENSIPLDELNDAEDQYILELNTLYPNGYNLRFNRPHDGKSMYSDETLKLMSESQSKVFDTKLDNYRRNTDELKNMPKHVNFIQRDKRRGYRIQNHPYCKLKDFLSSTKSIKILYQQTIDFLKQIEKTPHVSIRKEKIDQGLPEGIQKRKIGYEVQFYRNGIKYNKCFQKSSNTDEINLELAINWLNAIKKQLDNPEEVKSDEEVSLISKLAIKISKGIPKGITKYKGGNKTGYRIAFNINKIRYGKIFATNIFDDDDQLLQSAIKWMTDTKDKIKKDPNYNSQ